MSIKTGITPINLERDLAQFIGSERFYRHAIARNFIYTEGIRYMAEQAEAFWLIDYAALQFNKALRSETFVVLKLERSKPGHPHINIWIEDGNDNKLSHVKSVASDFLLDKFECYICQNDLGGNTMLLKGEY